MENNSERTNGICNGSLEDQRLQEQLSALVKKRCEAEIDRDKICNELLEVFVRRFSNNELDQCYEVIIRIRNAACYSGYKLASKDIANILNI